MGEVEVRGFLSQRPFVFEIAGDTPSATEIQRMQGILSQEEERWRQETEAATGFPVQLPEEDPGTAIGRGLRTRGIPQFQSSLGTAAEYAGLTRIGDYLQNAARERQLDILRENPALLEGQSFRDVRGLGSAFTYAGELVGEQLPLIGGTVAAGAATGGLGALAGLGTAGSVGLGTVAGTAAVSGPTLFGSNLERQEAEVAAGELARVDVGAAANAALAQTGLELLSNLILVGRIPSTIARAVAQNATAEGLTEIGQQALERQQAGLPVDSDDAIQEYLEAGIAGATLGAGFGGISRAFQRRPEEQQAGPDIAGLLPPPARPQLTGTRPSGPPIAGMPPAQPAALPAPGAAVDSARMAGTVPGAEGRGRSPAPTPPIAIPPQEGQTRRGDINVPELDPAAVATARSVGSDPQMLAAVRAIESEGKATIPVIQQALGLSYPAARGVMQKLENVGAVSKARGGRRNLSLPFPISVVVDAAPAQPTAAPAPAAPPVEPTVEEASDVQPRPEETEQQLARIPDADVADQRGAGARTEDGGRGTVEQSGPVVDQPAAGAAEAQPGGLGDRDGDLGATVSGAATQQPALTPTQQAVADVTGAFDLMGSGIARAARQRTADQIQKGEAPTFRRPDSVAAAKAEPRYNVTENPDGSVTVTGVQVDEGGPWVGASPEATPAAPTPQDQRDARVEQAQAEQAARSAEVDAIRDTLSPEDRAVYDQILDAAENRWAARRGALAELTGRDDAVLQPNSRNDKRAVDAARKEVKRLRKTAPPRPAEPAPETPAQQFRRSYAGRKTALRAFFTNPDLADLAQYANWLGSLSPAQWDKISPEFTRGDNPFLIGMNPNFDPNAAIAKFEQILATPDVDPDTLSAPQRVLDTPLTDPVIEALNAGDIRTALERLPAALSDRTMGKLARALTRFMDGITVQVVSASDPRLVARDDTVRPGAYLPSTREILLNAETGLNPQTLLHEAVHAATISVLSNPSHPLSQQIERIRERAAELLPPYYGLQDRFEFVSEGMTNPEFIRELSYAETVVGDDKVSLGRRFISAVTNFLRGLAGQRPRPLRSAKTELDNLFESLLAPAPEFRGTGTVIDALYGPGRRERAKEMLNSLSNRVVEATPKNMAEVRSTIRDTRIPTQVKDIIMRAAVPLPYIVQYASRYMPSAPQLKTISDEMHAEQRTLVEDVKRTANSIAKNLKKFPDRVADFERVRLGMSEPEAGFDFRKPYEYYSKYYFEFDVLDNDGNFVETRRSKAFDTAAARNRGMGRYNDNIPARRSGGRAVRRPTEEQLARQRELRKIIQSLPPELQADLRRALALPEYFRGKLAEALETRVKALMGGDGTAAKRVMGPLLRKIVSDDGLEGYQAFIRKGDYGMSFEAADPDTGEDKLFKVSFETAKQRLDARRLLEEAGAAVGEIKFYQRGQNMSVREQRPSLRFMAEILTAVENSGAPDVAALRDNILDLYWDATPETSFVHFFRRRVGTPGYDQDRTLLTLEPDVGSAARNIQDANSRLAYQVASVRYGARVEALNQQLDTEYNQFVDEANRTSTNPAQLDADLQEATMYRQKLREYAKEPMRKGAAWAANLNAGLFALTLGFNISTVAIQLFHLPMFTFTYQAPKYGSRQVMQAMGISQRYIAKSGSMRSYKTLNPDGTMEETRENVRWYNSSIQNYDYANDRKVQWLSPLNDLMQKSGVYTDSVAMEMAGDMYDLEAPGRRTAGSLVRKGAAYSGAMQHQVERVIRETSIMNAYMLMLQQSNPAWKAMSTKQFVRALENGDITIDADTAAQVARDAVMEGEYLNGSIYSSSGPQWSQSDIGRVAYLYKKFGLSMFNLLWHTATRSFGTGPNGTLTAEERRVAQLQLASMMGGIGLIAGAAGMPMFQLLANMYDLLKEDDEEDFETLVRTGVLGELGLNGLANYLTGLNIAPRVGMSGIFYREPFNAANNTPLQNIIEGFGGPAVGMFNKYTNNVIDLFQQGELWRATEQALPSAFGNVLRAARFYSDGITTMRGDPIVEEVGPLHLAGQFFGFQPADYAQQLAINNSQRRIDNAINRRISRLLARRYRAIRFRDQAEYQDIMEEIAEYNRRAEPDQRITREMMENSLRSHRATTERTYQGISYSQRNERMLREMATDYGPVSFLG